MKNGNTQKSRGTIPLIKPVMVLRNKRFFLLPYSWGSGKSPRLINKFTKFVIGSYFSRRSAKNGEKSAKFANVSPIVLMKCRFISRKENNLQLASDSPRRKMEISENR